MRIDASAPGSPPQSLQTRLVRAGSGAEHGIVNMPPFRASTILFESVDAYQRAVAGQGTPAYARYGTPSTQALQSAIALAEGGFGAVVLPSGLAAISVALLSVLRAGDHLLLTDAVYGPTRRLCRNTLARLGIECTFFPPTVGAEFGEYFKPNTRAVFLESPGSLTFEVQDVPRLADIAHRHGCRVLMDNTWATPIFFSPFRHGVDIIVHSATKYLVGHSDALMGLIVSADRETHETMSATWAELGQTAGADDCFLALRGLRTLDVRMRRHYESAVQVADWLSHRPEVGRVLYPALRGSPDHALWKRDFRGASGLFGIELRGATPAAAEAFADGLELFGIGASWGAHESLILPVHSEQTLDAHAAPILLRMHVGLEDPDDLIRDLARGFERLAQ